MDGTNRAKMAAEERIGGEFRGVILPLALKADKFERAAGTGPRLSGKEGMVGGSTGLTELGTTGGVGAKDR